MTDHGGPEPGSTLAGKYLVEKVLGVGGMGVVVSATHLQLDQRVAIKYLLPDALKNPEVVERFAREARAAAKIRGEHVARVIDVGRFDDGAPYMVMEYLEGYDLAKLLELQGPLAVVDAVRYMLETCEALAEAHAAKIVHRDLKPSNLFLATQPDQSSIIKVLDFGISKTGDAPSAALTKTTALMGTAFYMSPEQMMSPKDVDHRSDIWTLGVILYELLAGRQPFVGESVPEIIAQILQNEPVPLCEVRPDVPAGVGAVVAKCMQTKAANRFADVAELADALSVFGDGVGRSSVGAISRVLGKSGLGYPQTPSAAFPVPATLAVPTGEELAKREVGTARTEVLGAAPAVTSHGLASSSVGLAPPKKSPPVLAAAVGALVIASIAVGVVVTRKKDPTPGPEPRGGVVVQPTAEPSAPPLVTTPLPTAPPTPTTLASAPPTASPSASSAPPAIAAVPPSGRKNPIAAPAASSAPPPASTEKKNPLEIKIK